ncbi:hypothetical protein GGTG_09353 [Gaeumannomyces tritici R3-111a-1]|uniref:Uncharacterized protein n=1 Tax=Gaeumannomyces tritici (strain R3-111a-1) TaxID=644352 RepID=J3P756_GAET3|nr:hypothetical protein GGTG_09353 [Gaeumannomyces tritici R3-111a-1]EJT72487.1 hypothetical protein GGTG_09353 [Gaeumannomyces tritici R3-111a-1]
MILCYSDRDPDYTPALLEIAKAILGTGRFDFSALDRPKRRALLLGCAGLRLEDPTLASDLFQRGFHPFLTDVFDVDDILVPQLLAAIDGSLAQEYLQEAETREVIGYVRADETARRFIELRHGALAVALYKATVQVQEGQPNSGLNRQDPLRLKDSPVIRGVARSG